MSAATVLAVVSVVATVAAASGLMLDRVSTPWRAGILAASFAPFLMGLAVPALVLAALARSWVVLAVAAVVTAGCAVSQLRLRRVQPAPAVGTSVTVLQANVWLGKADPGALAGLVVEHEVDVLVVEELTEPCAEALEKLLADVAPHHLNARYRHDDAMVGIWSRHPMHDCAELTEYRHNALRARLTLPDGAGVTVLAIHLSTPLRWAREWWLPELRRLRDDLAALPADVPVLVAGDFNATTEHAQFRALLTGGYRDAAGQAGVGHPRSWPAQGHSVPIIAIDHVLTRDAVATSVVTVRVPGSDHRGLLVTAVLR